MTIKPGVKLYGIYDETAGGWMTANNGSPFISSRKLSRERMKFWVRHFNSGRYQDYTVREFVVPGVER